MKLFVQLTSLALLATLVLSGYPISKFEGLPFTVKPRTGVYNLSSLGFDNATAGATVIAYGDFNNDKFTDIVSLSDDQMTVTVMIYSHGSFSFWNFTTIQPGEPVVSVIPGDYDHNGQLDLLVNTLAANQTTQLRYYTRSQSEPFFSQEHHYSLDTDAQPFVFDVDGERRIDVMFMEKGVRKIQTLVDGRLRQNNFSQYISSSSSDYNVSSVITNKFATPHSNAFVDFNGDCAADLFVTSVDADNNLFFEIWIMGADSKFHLVDYTSITSPTIPTVSVGDINNDGRVDLVYVISPSDPDTPMNLHIVLNTFGTDIEAPCNSGVYGPIATPFTKDSYNAAGVDITGNVPTGARLFSADATNRPAKLRLGDINIDGYPDLLFVVTTADDSIGSVVLAINNRGTFDFGKVESEAEGFYTLLGDGTLNDPNQALSAVPAVQASFFDFDELGRLGMWIVTPSGDSQSGMLGAFNFVDSENFILKTLGLNGVVPTETDDVTSSLGGVYYGSSVECKVTDINGKASIFKGSQMPQSAYTPLDLPYIFIGLGRTNNYVENFVMGIANSTQESGDKQQTKWTPIIPNSQLIVNPLPNDDWTLDVYVNPTSETILIVITTLVILVLLGALIIYLHSKEKEEDNQSRDRWMRIGVA